MHVQVQTRPLRVTFAIFTMTASLLVAACSNNQNTANTQGLSQDQADALNAQRSHIEPSSGPPPAMSAETHYAAGQVAESQQKPDRAIEQYQAALRIDPNNEHSLYRLAVVEAQLHQYPAAIETWKRYAKVTNDSAFAYSNLGFCYELSGNITEAETAFKKGIAKDPKNEPCRINYGLMLARQGRTADAISQMQTVLPPAQVHYNLAGIFQQQGKTAEARAEYRQAIDLDPNLWDAQSRLAQLDQNR